MGQDRSVGEGGKLVRGSFAGRSLNRQPSFLRYVKFESTLKLLTLVFIVLASLFIGAMASADWLEAQGPNPGLGVKALRGVGAVCFLLAALLGWLVFNVWKALKQSFANGLLSAGMVVKVEPLTLAVLANIGNGLNSELTWGLVLEEVKALPGHELNKGEKVPCVCTFREGPESGRWGDISATPVCWGVTGRAVVDQALAVIDAEEFDLIRQCAKQKAWPENLEQMVVIRDGGEGAEVVERSGVTQRKAREAELAKA